MKPFVFLPLFLLLLSSCANYENQDSYQLKVGETVDIYYSTNSCCYYCVVNESELKHLKLIDEKVVKSGPRNTDGGNSTSAFVFQAISSGEEVVKLKKVEAAEDCQEYAGQIEAYQVNIN